MDCATQMMKGLIIYLVFFWMMIMVTKKAMPILLKALPPLHIKCPVPTHWGPPIDTANTHWNDPGHQGMTGVDSIAKSVQTLFSNLYINSKHMTSMVNAMFPRSVPHWHQNTLVSTGKQKK
ncbi:hypothetical protein BDN71DRAFT_1435733 [Pleurotus eryngii]|uniref:Uncharacterized protein n=1 Tax=Pleurotus eryngii TaxID=5323 RepID=A0A9P5ZKJ9_PLEER|nr:hypothetical protein BDN71DRAFT_1435733 [Pleurotus eryngii]